MHHTGGYLLDQRRQLRQRVGLLDIVGVPIVDALDVHRSRGRARARRVRSGHRRETSATGRCGAVHAGASRHPALGVGDVAGTAAEGVPAAPS